jgi:peptidoglycan/LPS O-acetylase OafA/YrhL
LLQRCRDHAISRLQKIGLVSYSVFLWQQLATAPLIWGGTETGAAALNEGSLLPLFILAPIASYFLIEKSMIVLGRSFSSRITAREEASAQRNIVAERG